MEANPNGNNKVPVICEKCNQRFSVDMPAIEVSNNLRSSMVVVVHPKLVYCPNAKCRQARTYIIGTYQVSVGTAPVNDEAVAAVEGSRIVKPTLGLVH